MLISFFDNALLSSHLFLTISTNILQLDNLNISKLSLEYVKRTFYINRVAGCVRCFVLSKKLEEFVALKSSNAGDSTRWIRH